MADLEAQGFESIYSQADRDIALLAKLLLDFNREQHEDPVGDAAKRAREFLTARKLVDTLETV